MRVLGAGYLKYNNSSTFTLPSSGKTIYVEASRAMYGEYAYSTMIGRRLGYGSVSVPYNETQVESYLTISSDGTVKNNSTSHGYSYVIFEVDE